MKLLLMAAIAMLPAGIWAQSVGPKSVPRDAAEQIRALEEAFDAAIVRRDVSALDKLTSDEFTLISMNGDLHTKAEVLKYFSTLTSPYEYRKTEDLRVRVLGDAAVVTGRTLETFQENGKDHSDAFRFTHVYIRQNGYWLLVAAQPTRLAVQ